MDITKIDKNFSSQPVDANGFLYRNVKEAPFKLEGLAWFKENAGAYYRLPKSFTKADVNEGALYLSNHTSGVCVRFRSNSQQIQIRAKLFASSDMNHMTRSGSAGFDSYRKTEHGELLFNKTVQPNANQVDIEAVAGDNDEGELCDWVINFPLYGGVSEVEIGLKEGSILLPPQPHKVPAPILFYGSSITQGGCASRPGNQYSSHLCRKVDAEQINLGFSGSGRGEIAVAKAIAGLKLSAFVFDYDHNAPNPEHLQATHEPFFQCIRKAQPKLPILLVSKCDTNGQEINNKRRDIIRATYEHAVQTGDRHVYFIDGQILFGTVDRDACTVDGCHPNDLGFYRMYEHILPYLEKALKESEL